MKLKELIEQYPEAQTFKFGDNEALCDELLALVRAGKKTATCGALDDFKSEDEAMPILGRKDIALNWDDTPSVLIETIDIQIKKFCDVDEKFALAEGENDSLEGWRHDHAAYFESNGGFRQDMLLVCEKFKLIDVY